MTRRELLTVAARTHLVTNTATGPVELCPRVLRVCVGFLVFGDVFLTIRRILLELLLLLLLLQGAPLPCLFVAGSLLCLLHCLRITIILVLGLGRSLAFLCAW